MYHKTLFILSLFLVFTTISAPASAKEACKTSDRICILAQMEADAASIKNQSWKDQTYREIAKTYAFERKFKKAVAVIDKIKTPDTKAMTIRGIGMTFAPQGHEKAELHKLFSALRVKAEEIEHPPSYAIALTYIAMAQAFAGDNEGAWKTAADMKNDALRHKAFAETAEIQAEKGDFNSARISIESIESVAFKNKAYTIVSKILSESGLYNDAYSAANAITNAYKKTQVMQYLLDKQKPRDVKH